jgi:hypothetical protein
MTYAIHNLHAPAVEIDAAGTMSHDDKTRIQLPQALFTAETREDAEAWRMQRQSEIKARQDNSHPAPPAP